jgi:proline racemase/trans-L-3-hydroxyproline dehydratase
MTHIRTVDYHTAGEPFRIVVDGAPTPDGLTILDRRANAESGELDVVRALLCNEPRGHADMYGGFLVPPDDVDGDLGVLFWHKDGFSTACGHGTIALATYAVDAGLVFAEDTGDTTVVIDVPSGRLNAVVHRVDGEVEHVRFTNVPSYVLATDIRVETKAGPVIASLSYGGAVYASVRAADLGLRVHSDDLSELISLGREIKWALNDHPSAQHPSEPRLSGVYGTIWFQDVADSADQLHQRNCTVFADGEVDRSPCGSGTSARLALLASEGLVSESKRLLHESIIGTQFVGTVVGSTVAEDRPAVITQVQGSAFRTGEHSFYLDPRDPVGLGFQLR